MIFIKIYYDISIGKVQLEGSLVGKGVLVASLVRIACAKSHPPKGGDLHDITLRKEVDDDTLHKEVDDDTLRKEVETTTPSARRWTTTPSARRWTTTPSERRRPTTNRPCSQLLGRDHGLLQSPTCLCFKIF